MSLWQPQLLALLDVCVVDTDAPPHMHCNRVTVLRRKRGRGNTIVQFSTLGIFFSINRAGKRNYFYLYYKWLAHRTVFVFHSGNKGAYKK